MEKDEVQGNISLYYPGYIDECNILYGSIITNITTIFPFKENEENEYYVKADFRITFLSRLLSVVINTKTNLYLLNNFINKDNWEVLYNTEIIPSKSSFGYLNFIKDLDTEYRQSFFLQFFSQIESFANTLCREKKICCKDPLFDFLKLGKGADDKFIYFVKGIRNSIHNNGYFYPSNKHEVVYEENKLVEGETMIFFDWQFAFKICNKLLEYSLESINSDEIMSIPLFSDK